MSNIRLSLNDLCSHAHRITEYAGSKSASSTCILMLPRQNKAWVGFGRQYCVRYQENKFIIEDDKGKVREIVSDNPFGMLDQILDAKANYFFMISLDLHRPGAKSKLPTMIWIQAKHEIMVDATQDAPYGSADGLADSHAMAEKLNQQFVEKKIQPLNFSDTAQKTDWTTGDDENFVKRLGVAVEALQKIDGKIIVTRAYSTVIQKNLDPFRLYEIYNHLEPACAASYFMQLDDRIFSLGCTPENIFTLHNNILDFDVVASTRGVSLDPEKDARWESELKSAYKELKEHNMALPSMSASPSGWKMTTSVLLASLRTGKKPLPASLLSPLLARSNFNPTPSLPRHE